MAVPLNKTSSSGPSALLLGAWLLVLPTCNAAECTGENAADLSPADLHVGERISEGEGGLPSESCPFSGWTSMSSGTTQDLLSIWGNRPDNIFAVGAAGTIVHFNGMNWRTMNVPASSAAQTLRSVKGSGDGDVFAVGTSSAILHYDGVLWREMSAQTSTEAISFNSVSPASGRTIAVGTSTDSSVSSIFTLEGLSWRSMAGQGAPLGASLNGLWSSAGQELIAVGGNQEAQIYRFNGQRWSLMAIPSTVEVSALQAVWGLSPGSIYAVGRRGVDDRGVIIYFNGDYWATMHTSDLDANQHYTALWGNNMGEIFALAAGSNVGSTIQQFDGSSWKKVSLPSRVQSYFFNDAWGPDPQQLYVVGNQGTILRWCRSANE